MSTDSTPYRGIVHGTTIKLDQETGLPEGQPVEVKVVPVGSPDSRRAAGKGLQSSFGTWEKDQEELDDYLRKVRKQRKVDRPELEP